MLVSVQREPTGSREPPSDGISGGAQRAGLGGHVAGGGGPVKCTSRPHSGRMATDNPANPTRRRLSTKGVKRPGYKRRVSTPFSYVELISMAIKASPNCMLTLREILAHLEKHNECFQGSYVGWKNSVRHNLSSSKCFVKLLRNSMRPFAKDNFWAMNPDCLHCQSADRRDRSWRGHSTVPTPPPALDPLPAAVEEVSPRAASSPPVAFTDRPEAPVLHGPCNDTSPAHHPHVPGGNTAPSRIFAEQVAEPFLQQAVTSASPSPVSSDPSTEPISALSPAADDDSVQSFPLDLSMPAASKRRAHSPAAVCNSSPPFQDAKIAPGFSDHRDSSSVSLSITDNRPAEKCYRTAHSLPVSRFLHSPNDGRQREIITVPCSKPIPAGSCHQITDRDARIATDLSSYSLPCSIIERCGHSNSTIPCLTATRPWGAVSQDGIPRTPEEMRFFQNLYEHYWNRALNEREALYRRHLTMLEDRQAKLRGWHPRPVTYFSSSKLPEHPPLPVPRSSFGRAANSWLPIQ